MISLATILSGTMYYTGVKATEKTRPPPLSVDVEALQEVNEKAIDWRLWKVIRPE